MTCTVWNWNDMHHMMVTWLTTTCITWWSHDMHHMMVMWQRASHGHMTYHNVYHMIHVVVSSHDMHHMVMWHVSHDGHMTCITWWLHDIPQSLFCFSTGYFLLRLTRPDLLRIFGETTFNYLYHCIAQIPRYILNFHPSCVYHDVPWNGLSEIHSFMLYLEGIMLTMVLAQLWNHNHNTVYQRDWMYFNKGIECILIINTSLPLQVCRLSTYELCTVFNDDFKGFFENVMFPRPYILFLPNLRHVLPHPLCAYGTIAPSLMCIWYDCPIPYVHMVRLRCYRNTLLAESWAW